MNKVANILTAKRVFFSSLILSAVLLALLAPKAAVNVDEQLHYPHAKKVVNWYFTGGEDKTCLTTPNSNLKYYGQSVDNFTALINRVFKVENEFLVRHFTGALFFWLLLLFAGGIAFEITNSFWAAAITVISILLMPRLFGQAFGNLKDIPFATGYTASVYLIIKYIKELPAPRWSVAVGLALAIAFTCSVRIGGLILLAYFIFTLVVIFVMKPFVPRQNVSTKPCLVRLLGQGFVIGIIGYFAGLLFWPFALQDVFRNPYESLQLMEHYKVSIRQIFNGHLFWSTQLPWSYLPKWILISTPEFILLGTLFYFFSLIKKIKVFWFKQLTIELFLVFSLFFPLFYVLIIKANLYSGIRQMLFVMPVFGILSAVGMYRIFSIVKPKGIKSGVVLLMVLLMILPFRSQAKTFPVDYVYFNNISGGAENAWGKYEYDYYFHGIKKSSEYLIDLVGNKQVTVASNCNLSNYFDKLENINYKYTPYIERSSADWDYGLFGLNYIPPEMLENGMWFSTEIVKLFFHQQNPIAVIVKRNDKTDYLGIEKAKSKEYDVALRLLENARKKDINNVWLYAQLAKISLELNDIKSFNRYLQNGRKIYSNYEPFYLLEAQFEYNRGNFKEAKQVLNNLIQINNRYLPAKKLIYAVDNKLNKTVK